MDLSKYDFCDDDRKVLTDAFSYQPYVFSSDYRSGSGLQFLTAETTRKMTRSEVSPERWAQFAGANDRLAAMYDEWADAALAQVKKPLAECSAVDVACNEGYFLHRLRERGVGEADGYDILDLEKCFDIMGKATGRPVRYHRQGYNQMTHTVPGIQPADIVVSTAYICHLSDPTFHLAFLGSICRDTLLLYTAVHDQPGFSVTYLDITNRYYKTPFPVCFDSRTSISYDLLMYAFKRMEFKTVTEVPAKPNWLPIKHFRAFIASR